jgi:hypothetical protein
MEVGDTVTKSGDTNFRGTVVQMPRSVGRKRPRALVASVSGEAWLFVDELRKVGSDDNA